MEGVALRKAIRGDLRSVRSLLMAADLPFEDVDLVGQEMIVAVRGSEIIGTVGLESKRECGLLRSLAVDEAFRGKGLGRELVAGMAGRARALGIKKLYLLTLTADRFFEKEGFERINRESVPEDIKGTTEFHSVCPVSSVCMKKDIQVFN